MNNKLISIFIMAIVLCFSGFNNKFPLLRDESVDFISNVFNKAPPKSQKVAYETFITHASWGQSMWLIILVQALVLSTVLFYVFNYLPPLPNPIAYIFFVFFITFCTSVSVSISSIVPGAFMSTSLLCTVLLLLGKRIYKRDLAIISMLFFISTIMDITHIFSVSVLTVVFVTIKTVSNKTKKNIYCEINKKRIALICFLIMSVLFTSLTIAEFVHNPVYISNISSKNMTEIEIGTQLNISGYHRIQERTKIFEALLNHFPGEIREYLISRQNQEWLSLKYINYCNITASMLFLVASLVMLVKYNYKPFSSLLLYMLTVQGIQFLFIILFYKTTSDKMWEILWLIILPIFIYYGNFLQKLKESPINTKLFSFKQPVTEA